VVEVSESWMSWLLSLGLASQREGLAAGGGAGAAALVWCDGV